MRRILPWNPVVLALGVALASGLARGQVPQAPEGPVGTYFGGIPDPAKTKHYYLAAEPVLWNFAPKGQDPVCGKTFPPALLLNRVSWKIRYVQYTDATFSARVLPEERLGIMGPVLRGTTGQYLMVTFLNRAWLPLSMHPHGVKYDKDSEGSFYQPHPGRGSSVAPGAMFTYVWYLDESSGPRPDEPSSKAWLYHSHVTGDGEANLGLMGFIVVTDPARARADGTPIDVDREEGVLMMIFDESNPSAVSEEEADERPPNAPPPGPVNLTWSESAQALEEGQRHTMNGLVFGNLSGLEMNEGERVRWYLFGLGSENDNHTLHWHGLRVTEDGRRRTDVVELLPGSMKVADMVADNPGKWLIHCHVAEHMENGMFTLVTVVPKGDPPVSRDPEKAFFGMPQALQTLRFQEAEYSPPNPGARAGSLFLAGQVTVPSPFPVSRNAFAVTMGSRTAVFSPDRSGIAATPDGILLVKNLSTFGNGNVIGGRLDFELTLKGPAWAGELDKLGLVENGVLVPGKSPQVTLMVGKARHVASFSPKVAAPQ